LNGVPLGQKITKDRVNFKTDSQIELIETTPQTQSHEQSNHYYCSIGASFTSGRDVAEAHCTACLFSGLNFKSFNSESSLAEWKFEIGPLDGVEVGDHIWIARYILLRVAEQFGLVVKYENCIIENIFETQNKNGFK
jgi:glutamine synthetase